MKRLIYILLLLPLFAYGQGTNVVHMAARPVVGGAAPAPTNIISNGTFDDATLWTFGGDWSHDAVNLEADYTVVASSFLSQTAADMQTNVSPNSSYTLSFDLNIASGGAIVAYYSSNGAIAYTGGDYHTTSPVSVTVTTPADIGVGGFSIRASAASENNFSVDNIVLMPQ